MQTFTFLNTTQNERGNSVNICVTNSHIAARQHASRRLRGWHGRIPRFKKDPENVVKTIYLPGTKVPKHEDGTPHVFSNQRGSDGLISSPVDSRHGVPTDVQRSVSTEAIQQILTDALHPADLQLSTALDPFVHIPVEVSDRERSLLHFQLSEGRLLTLGTQANPVYCPSLYLAGCAMENWPIYIYSTIAQSELLQQRLTGTPPPKSFHLRQVQAYTAMQALLKDDSASFEHKLAGFSQLFLLAIYLNRPDLQELHLCAMYDWVLRQGGFSRWMPKKPDFQQTKNLAFFASHFAEVNLPVRNIRELHLVLFRFVSNLRAIRDWARYVYDDFRRYESPDSKFSVSAGRRSSMQLAELRTYLDWLLEAGIGLSDDGCSRSGGGFYLLFNLCITQAEYRHSYAEALHFVEHTARVTSGSAESITLEDGRKLWRPVPTSIAIIMGYVRATMLGSFKDSLSDVHAEVLIAESSINARLILPYLSDAMKLNLAKMFLTCACTSIANPSLMSKEDIFDDEYVNLITEHVVGVWKTNQKLNRGFDGTGKTAYNFPKATKSTRAAV